MSAKKKARPSDPNHVVVEVRVNQDQDYKTVDKRTDAAWEERLTRDWKSAKTQRNFAASELRSESQLFKGYDLGVTDQTPNDVREAIEKGREWYEKSSFVKDIVALRKSLFNFGFEVIPACEDEDEQLSQSDEAAFEKWKKEYRTRIKRFAHETWIDKSVISNVVALWRKPTRSNPVVGVKKIITLPPERCKYTDSLGIEILQVKFGWKEEDFRSSASGNSFFLSPDELKRYSSGNYVRIEERKGEFFKVYKDERVGWGFAKPSVMTLNHVFSQVESMEVADRLWAYACRLVERRHKIGHEIRTGPRAGLPIHFINKLRSTETLRFYQGRTGGLIDTANNFDQDIEFPFPSSDRFNREKYLSIWERMALWAGPCGLYLYALYTGKGTVPLLMETLEAQANDEREMIRDFLVDVITAAFNPPVEIDVCWSNRVFQDKRQRFEAIKFLASSGALSQKTALREFDFCEVEERKNKQEEAELAKKEATKGQVLPLYDPAHGPVDRSTGGRPAGQKDGGPRAELNGQPPTE